MGWILGCFCQLGNEISVPFNATTQLPDLVAWKMERKDKRWSGLAVETMKQSTSMNLKGNLPR